MTLKDINFKELQKKYTNISIGNCDKWYIGPIDEVLNELPEDWVNKEIKEQKEFFGKWIIKIKKEN